MEEEQDDVVFETYRTDKNDDEIFQIPIRNQSNS